MDFLLSLKKSVTEPHYQGKTLGFGKKVFRISEQSNKAQKFFSYITKLICMYVISMMHASTYSI